MEFSTAAYWRLKRSGGQISLSPLAAIATALVGRPVAVRWGTWADNDMIAPSLGHWDPTRDEICIHRSLGWNLDQRLPETFYHELAHAVVPRRGKGAEEREAQANHFAEMALRKIGPDFVWWLVGGMDDHEA